MRIVAGAIVALVIAAVIGALDTSDAPEQATTSTTAPRQLTGDAQELFDLLERKNDATYHARYQGSSPDATEVVIETWQQPPRIRQTSIASVQGRTVTASSFMLPDGSFRCSQLGTEPWQCRASSSAEAGSDPLAAIAERLASGEVTARDDRVQERLVRCFSLRAEDGLTDLCVTPDAGIPVSVQAGESRLELVALDQAVSDTDFELPAEVTP